MFDKLFGKKDDLAGTKAPSSIKIPEGYYQKDSSVFFEKDGKLEAGWKIKNIEESTGVVTLRRELPDGYEVKDVSMMDFKDSQMKGTAVTKKDASVFVDVENHPELKDVVFTVAWVKNGEVVLNYPDLIHKDVSVTVTMKLDKYLESAMIAPPRKRIID